MLGHRGLIRIINPAIDVHRQIGSGRSELVLCCMLGSENGLKRFVAS
jgi:hypothetical protein